jgi:Sortase domain
VVKLAKGAALMMRVRRPALLVLGLVLATAALVGVVRALDRGHVKQPAAAPLPSAIASDPASPAQRLPGALPSASASRVTPTPSHQTGLGPSRIRIPALNVTATIGESAVVDGVLTPPRVPDEVGAWAGSAPLDAHSGEVTIAGHVNWAGMAPFAFGRLAYLDPGDLVYTTDSKAEQTAWRVSSVTARPKTEPIDASAFIGARGQRRLALITCGGSFDAGSSSYDDNVYVYATPVPL